MSRRGAVAAVRVLTTAHDYAIPKVRFDIYVDALADLDDDLLDVAARRLVRTLKWFPKPAEIRADALGARLGPTASAAWAEVVDQIRSVGRASLPVWSSPQVGTAVRDAGGWRALCDSTTPDVDRRRFFIAYEAAAEDRRRVLLAGDPA